MYNIIITGSLGTGKSSVSDILKKKGLPVLSADILINGIYEEKIFTEKIAGILSMDSADVSKLAVAKMVFQDKKKLEELEKLLYPELKKRVQGLRASYKEKKVSYLFYEAPVFFEKNQTTDYDCVLVVSASKEVCCSRLLKKNMSKEQFEKVVSLQMPIKKKESLADYVIFNNSDLDHLAQETELFLKFLKKKYE